MDPCIKMKLLTLKLGSKYLTEEDCEKIRENIKKLDKKCYSSSGNTGGTNKVFKSTT